jgi:hypothetical protein
MPPEGVALRWSFEAFRLEHRRLADRLPFKRVPSAPLPIGHQQSIPGFQIPGQRTHWQLKQRQVRMSIAVKS